MQAYYLKPPNVSWGLLFPLAWTGMFLIRSGQDSHSLLSVLPGMIALSVLFGTSSMLAVAVTFEKKAKAFERLLLSPIPLYLLMLAKTSGAVLFGMFNALVPVLLGFWFADLSGADWGMAVPAVLLIAVVSTFLSLLLAILATEVFEVQTLSNFVRFPMIFLCGLFFPSVLSLCSCSRYRFCFRLPMGSIFCTMPSAANSFCLQRSIFRCLQVSAFCFSC